MKKTCLLSALMILPLLSMSVTGCSSASRQNTNSAVNSASGTSPNETADASDLNSNTDNAWEAQNSTVSNSKSLFITDPAELYGTWVMGSNQAIFNQDGTFYFDLGRNGDCTGTWKLEGKDLMIEYDTCPEYYPSSDVFKNIVRAEQLEITKDFFPVQNLVYLGFDMENPHAPGKVMIRPEEISWNFQPGTYQVDYPAELYYDVLPSSVKNEHISAASYNVSKTAANWYGEWFGYISALDGWIYLGTGDSINYQRIR